MSARGRHRACAAALVTALSLGRPCAAQSEAEQATQRGLELRRQWRDAEALDEFRRAYALARTPRLRAQIALAEQALGKWRDAEIDLEAALASSDDPWIASSKRALDAARALITDHLATLEATSNAPGALLRVGDDAPVALPCAFRVERGPVRVRVEAKGFEPVDRTLTVGSVSIVKEHFDLVAHLVVQVAPPQPPEESPPSSTPLTLRPPEDGAAAPSTESSLRTTAPGPSPAAPTPIRSRVAWGALGGAGLALGLGVLATILRENAAVAYDDNTRCPPGQKQALCGAYSAEAQTATVLSIVGYGAAASLAATGVLLLVSPSHKAPPVTAFGGGGFVGGALSGTF
jgi:hypothetical protein